MEITATVASPIHFETFSDPQCCFVIPISGTGRLTTRTRTLDFRAGQILHLSFSSSMMIDYGDFSGVSIKPGVTELMLALDIPRRHEADVLERIQNGADRRLPHQFNGVDYYSIIRSILAFIDHADGDELYLQQIGFDSLITKVIARILLHADPAIARVSRARDKTLPMRRC